MNKPFLSVIIPAYNEARRLPLTLVDIDAHLSKQDYSYEILVVDDGSTDATAEIVRRFLPVVKHLRLFQLSGNCGKGAAVRHGMKEAHGNVRLFTDADNSTSLDQFNRMLPLFKEGYSVLIGSRGVSGAVMDPPQSLFRRAVGKMGNFLIRFIAVPGISDTQCGFKAFNEDAAERIFSLARIDGWGFDVEALVLANALGFRVGEVPVRWRDSTFSHLTLFDYPLVLWETLKIRWWIHKNNYALN